MTTLENRPNAALLVVDVQVGVVAGSYQRDQVVANVGGLVDRARQDGVPVVWVQHNDDHLARGSEGWEIVPELERDDAEPLVEKQFGRLIVCGAQTDMCIRSTLHGALARGYDVTLVKDAHTTEDLTSEGAPPPKGVIAHTNLYWSWQSAPGRTAGTVEAEQVTF